MNRELEAKNFVSTHSRLKAAGLSFLGAKVNEQGFNTQPPEGGWCGGLKLSLFTEVSTHSRLKAAG